ncbi:MAG: PASTA domain-containing protein, partial [Defluviitaleaceae bacterium]|nr:PASTA domain-containing protein [Defluviitaleaceae bacterium]
GQVTGPIMQVLLENVLPYLGVKPVYNEAELAEPGARPVTVPDVRGETRPDALHMLKEVGLGHLITGEGDTVAYQFPIPGELVNQGEKVHLRME